MKYEINFWFEHVGPCLWGANKITKEKYGYAIFNDEDEILRLKTIKPLPISPELRAELCALEKEYATILDWSDPGKGYVWSEEHKRDFAARADAACERLRQELGKEYKVSNTVRESLR